MAIVYLDNQVFYSPPVEAGPSPASRGLVVREGDPAPLLPLPPQQDAHDSRHGDAGKSQRNVILISDSEPDDDFDDGRSDTSFASPDELVATASKNVISSGVAGAGESRDTVPDDSDVSEPSVTSGPGLDDEFTNEQQQRGGLGPSPETLSGSPRPSEKPCGTTSNHDGSLCLDNEEWDRRFPFSRAAILRRRAAQPQSMLDPHGRPQSPRPPASGLGFEFQQQSDGHCLSEHCDRCGDSSQTGSPEHHHHHLVPDDREQRARTITLPDDESTSELEPADPEPRLRPQSPCEVASSRGVGPQLLRPGSGRLSQHRDHHDDSDLASDGEHLVPDDREQDEDGTPGPQDRRAMSKSTSEESAQQQSNLALATEASPVKPAGILLSPGTRATRRKHVSFGHNVKQGAGTTRATTTELPDEDQVDLQQNTGRCRRRRRCDTEGKEDCVPIVGSDAKQGKDGDVIQPPRGKRRKLNTAPKKRARLRTSSLSLQAQQPPPPPTQGPKRRESQRRISKPQSSGPAALEEETLEAAFASFEEWPLEAAVLKRVCMGGEATFQLQFPWNHCTNHGQHGRVPEKPRRKPPGGRISSTARAIPSQAASTTGKTQGDGYFNVEKILKWRKGEKGLEYLVKWVGYGKKDNSWEPPGHFDRCLEILEQFHREKGLAPPWI